MGDDRRSKYVIPDIDQNYLELDKQVSDIYLYVVIKLDAEKGCHVLSA